MHLMNKLHIASTVRLLYGASVAGLGWRMRGWIANKIRWHCWKSMSTHALEALTLLTLVYKLGKHNKDGTGCVADIEVHNLQYYSLTMSKIVELKMRARSRAIREYKEPKTPAETALERKRQMRNKSAFITRQKERHYVALLSQHIKRAERGRDHVAHLVRITNAQCQQLRFYKRQLEAALRNTGTRKMLSDGKILDQVLSNN